jgi:hypothetical protein
MCSALQLYVDLERLLEAVSIVSLSSRAPDPYRSPPFFCNCQESSEHCNFVLPLTGWRLQHPSSSRRVTCDPVVLDVRTVLILQVHLLLYFAGRNRNLHVIVFASGQMCARSFALCYCIYPFSKCI